MAGPGIKALKGRPFKALRRSFYLLSFSTAAQPCKIRIKGGLLLFFR